MAKKLKTGPWSKEDVKILRKMFPNSPTLEVAAKLNRPLEAVKKKASRMGLYKSQTYLRKLGRR